MPQAELDRGNVVGLHNTHEMLGTDWTKYITELNPPNFAVRAVSTRIEDLKHAITTEQQGEGDFKATLSDVVLSSQ